MTDDIPAFALVGIIVTPERVKRIKAVGTVPNLFATYPFYNADKFGFYGPAMMDHHR